MALSWLESRRARFVRSAWAAFALSAIAPPLCLAEADAGAAKPLACAVEGAHHPREAALLCRRLGDRLGAPVRHVADARAVKRSASVQLILHDVQWIVVYLERGKVRAFTRISTVEAQRREALLFARAVRMLSKLRPAKEADPCLRVESRRRRTKSLDLVYPWAELKTCQRHVLGVVDPWGPTPARP